MHEAEFREIYRNESGAVYNFLLWLSGSRETANDIIQRVFIKLWQGKAKPKSNSGYRSWLLTVARNEYIDICRTVGRRRRMAEQLRHEADGCTTKSDISDLEGIWKCLTALSEEQRSIIFLHIRQGYPYKEIATFLKISETNVRVKLCRALKKLKQNPVCRELYFIETKGV